MVLMDKINDKSAIINIIGLGYVGLPTALAFSKKGFKVIGIDTDKEKIKMINQGISPISDETIIIDIERETKEKRFYATNDYGQAIPKADIIILILPTPVNLAKEPDLKYIKNAAVLIAKFLKKNQLVILESTVYPGVTEEILLPILEESGLNAPEDFGLAYCPERFNPGDKNKTVEKVVRVIGGINAYWTNVTNKLYSQIQKTFITTNIKTAEAAKVIENTQRDLNIALINEFSLICERLNLDVIDVLEAASTKWNFNSYSPGPGVGGHCLPHDPYYLVKIAKEKGYHAQVILSGRKVNDDMPLHVKDLLISGLNYRNKSLKDTRVLIFGATYKKNVDDIRTSPTETLVNSLTKYGSKITLFEPNVDQKIIFDQKNIQDFKSKMARDYDAFIFMVAHDRFKEINFDFLKECIEINPNLILVDGARILNGLKLKEMGYIYLGIGAGTINESYRI